MSELCYAQSGENKNKIQFGISVGPGYSYRPKNMSFAWPTASGGGVSIRKELFGKYKSMFSGRVSAKFIQYHLRLNKDLEDWFERNEISKGSVGFSSVLSQMSIKVKRKEVPYGIYTLGGVGIYFWNQNQEFVRAIEDFKDDETRFGILIGGGIEYTSSSSQRFYIESSLHTMRSKRDDKDRIKFITSEFGLWF